jgi:hypothetical protein
LGGSSLPRNQRPASGDCLVASQKLIADPLSSSGSQCVQGQAIGEVSLFAKQGVELLAKPGLCHHPRGVDRFAHGRLLASSSILRFESHQAALSKLIGPSVERSGFG